MDTVSVCLCVTLKDVDWNWSISYKYLGYPVSDVFQAFKVQVDSVLRSNSKMMCERLSSILRREVQRLLSLLIPWALDATERSHLNNVIRCDLPRRRTQNLFTNDHSMLRDISLGPRGVQS